MEQAHLALNHNPILVGASFVVAIFAAFTALTTINRLRQGTAGSIGWLWLGATTFGLGVWAMHFIAMTALDLDMLVAYNPLITLASVFFSIFGAAAAFRLVSRPKVGAAQVLAAGFSLGAGIGVMHYVGMFAMRLDAKLEFDLLMVGVSVLVAVVLGTFGMWILTSRAFDKLAFRGLVTAVVTGSAIPFMHYTAMLAAKFTGTGGDEIHSMVANGNLLSLNIFLLVAIMALGLPNFLNSLLDTQGERLQESEA